MLHIQIYAGFETVAVVRKGIVDYNNKKLTHKEIIAGNFVKTQSLDSPLNSGAFDCKNEVAFWNVIVEKVAVITLPKASAGGNRIV